MVAPLVRLSRFMRLCLFASAACGIIAGWGAARAESKVKAEDVVLRGKVVPLLEALKQAAPDLKPDAKPADGEVVLMADGGSIIPLISDEAGRALFQDERLRHRTVEIRGRRWPGLPYVQVITLRVEEEGRLRTPEYFCHVCTISLRYPQTCPCCQGPMEFRMKSETP